MVGENRLEIRELDRTEVDAVLGRNRVGRVAFCIHDYVSVEPIHYIYDGDESIYGRTSPGVKLATVRHNERVAFEVDEADALHSWRSVIVHGRFRPIVEGGPEWSREAWERAVALLRRLDADSFTPRDPAPHREIVFRIEMREVTGRAASPPSRRT